MVALSPLNLFQYSSGSGFHLYAPTLTQLCSHFVCAIGYFEFVTSKQQKEALKVTVWVSLSNLVLSSVSL